MLEDEGQHDATAVAKETQLIIDILSKSLVAEEERILGRTESQKQYAVSATFKNYKEVLRQR